MWIRAVLGGLLLLVLAGCSTLAAPSIPRNLHSQIDATQRSVVKPTVDELRATSVQACEEYYRQRIFLDKAKCSEWFFQISYDSAFMNRRPPHNYLLGNNSGTVPSDPAKGRGEQGKAIADRQR